jgi:hypothetical protein
MLLLILVPVVYISLACVAAGLWAPHMYRNNRSTETPILWARSESAFAGVIWPVSLFWFALCAIAEWSVNRSLREPAPEPKAPEQGPFR